MTNALTAQSVKILNILDASLFQKSISCQDIEHVEFIIKSEYLLNQVSTKLDFIKKDNCFFSVNKGNLLFEVMFRNENGTFQIYKITDNGFNKIEANF